MLRACGPIDPWETFFCKMIQPEDKLPTPFPVLSSRHPRKHPELILMQSCRPVGMSRCTSAQNPCHVGSDAGITCQAQGIVGGFTSTGRLSRHHFVTAGGRACSSIAFKRSWNENALPKTSETHLLLTCPNPLFSSRVYFSFLVRFTESHGLLS